MLDGVRRAAPGGEDHMLNLKSLPTQAWDDLRLRLWHLTRHHRRRALRPGHAEVPRAPLPASPVPPDSGVDLQWAEVYQAAIERYVQPGQVVMDLGTGNGLRAILAARRGPGKLYAVDSSRHLDTTQWVARRNGLSDIEFVRMDSACFAPPEKVDVLLHEQLGEALFDTGLIPKVLDARDRLLGPLGRILPNRFEVFFEPVQLREEARLPFIWSQRLPQVDFSCLEVLRDELHPAYFTRLIRPQDVERVLGEPEPAFTLDLETLQAGTLPRKVLLERRVEREGRMDGLGLFYRARFDDSLSFGTFPVSQRPSRQVMLLRIDPREFARYETIRLELSLPELSDVTTWRWNFV